MRQKLNSTVSVASEDGDSDDGHQPGHHSTSNGGLSSAPPAAANNRPASSSDDGDAAGQPNASQSLAADKHSNGFTNSSDASAGKNNPRASPPPLRNGNRAPAADAPAGSASPSPPAAAAAPAAPAARDSGGSEYNSDSSTFSSSVSGNVGNHSSRDGNTESLEVSGNGLAHQAPAAAGMSQQQLAQSSLLFSTSKHPNQQQQHPMMHSSSTPADVAAAAAAAGGASGPPAAAGQLEMLLGELRREAGLSEEQAASAAALLQRFSALSAAGGSSPNAQAGISALDAPGGLSLPGQWGPSPGTPPTGPAGLSSNPAAAFLQAGGAAPAGNTMAANMVNMAAAAAAAGLLGPAGNLAAGPGAFAGLQHGLCSMGFENGQSAVSAENLLQQQQSASGSEGVSGGTSAGVSGSSYAGMPGLVSGLTSSEAVYGTDGLDAPGTAQVAVHNVPFKWCNADLEALFKQLPGFLDAQLLFHENGRSKGVGVALFGDANSANEACGQLTGVQADGRKLEMVLMSPDNHISFSCKQVAVLGLPWEYTAADVRALIEAAAEADGAQASEAGVEAVEVAYREDGKRPRHRDVPQPRAGAQRHHAPARPRDARRPAHAPLLPARAAAAPAPAVAEPAGAHHVGGAAVAGHAQPRAGGRRGRGRGAGRGGARQLRGAASRRRRRRPRVCAAGRRRRGRRASGQRGWQQQPAQQLRQGPGPCDPAREWADGECHAGAAAGAVQPGGGGDQGGHPRWRPQHGLRLHHLLQPAGRGAGHAAVQQLPAQRRRHPRGLLHVRDGQGAPAGAEAGAQGDARRPHRQRRQRRRPQQRRLGQGPRQPRRRHQRQRRQRQLRRRRRGLRREARPRRVWWRGGSAWRHGRPAGPRWPG
ncbi:hypothetical protein COO60DRAFT_598684 [Scenedesmus sp. NREL 46B-D3]|nr:hypothetical protein COO60DRAFT_598684 [Scenedesmus sp. NREL 46B-D3]